MATAAGGSTSTAYLLLDIVPSNQLLVGFFIIACIISMAMGTSCGTISVLVTILGLNVLLVLGSGVVMFAVVGMFTVEGFSVSTMFTAMD